MANDRLVQYGMIAAGVLLLSLLATLVISSKFRRLVADPIVRLSETARPAASEGRVRGARIAGERP